MLGLGWIRVRVRVRVTNTRPHTPARGWRDGGAQKGERHPLVLAACMHHKRPAHPAPTAAATVEDAAPSAAPAATAASATASATSATATAAATAAAVAAAAAAAVAAAAAAVAATAAVESLGRGARIDREAGAQWVMRGVVAERALCLRADAPLPGTAG